MENKKYKDHHKGCKGCCVFDLDCPIVECREKLGKYFSCLCTECIIKCMCMEACVEWLQEINKCKELLIEHTKKKYKEAHEKNT